MITVLAEQGRCRAGSDLDWALEKLIFSKIAQATGVERPELIYAAYDNDVAAGRVMFEEDCEQRKLELSQAESIRWTKERFLGWEHIEFTVTQGEFARLADRSPTRSRALSTVSSKRPDALSRTSTALILLCLWGAAQKCLSFADVSNAIAPVPCS